jgi:tripartite-type tricarboxylate transporter receptor subunit TctC
MRARHRCAIAAISLLAATLVLGPAGADDFPNRKITFVVGFAPGGGIDTMARVVAQGITDQLGHQIVIENRPGAASNIAARAVASAPPDGYTLLATGNSIAINQTYYKNPGYSTDEVAAIAFAARDSMTLAVNANHPARTLAEFVALSKDKGISFGFGGSSARIGGEYIFNVVLKAKATGVPFQSGAPAINALLGNHVDIVAAPIAEIYPHVQQGKLRSLVVTGKQRSRAFPDVPTLGESGLPTIEISGWNGFFAPSKIAPDIGMKLNGIINAAVKSPAVEQRLRQLGYEPFTLDHGEAPAFFKEAIDGWARMVRETGVNGE